MVQKTMEKRLPHRINVKIKAVYGSLKSAEKKAADYLLKDHVGFAMSTITEVARAAGCSEATLFRFAKKLGYESYPDLKEDLLQDDDKVVVNLMASFEDTDTHYTILKKTFLNSMQALDDTMLSIGEEQFCGAVEALKGARKVLCCGVGDAAVVAHALHNKFLRIDREAYFASDMDLAEIICAHFSKNDVLICISHSGVTKSVVHLAKRMRKKGVVVISINNYPMSLLAKNADFNLFTATFDEAICGEIVAKRITELCIAESLFLCLVTGSETYTRAMQRADESAKIHKF